MAAATKDIVIDAFAGFALDVQCRDAAGGALDLTGYEAFAALSSGPRAALPLADFAVTVDGPAGLISVRMSAAATGALQEVGKARWDLVLQPPAAERLRLLEGEVWIKPGATRIPA